MNEKYEQLKSKIQAANPSILDLKFGCEASFSRYPGGPQLLANVLSTNNDRVQILLDGRTTPEIHDKDAFKILGRPIRLTDVLLAIEQVSLPKHLLTLPSGNMYLFESGVLDSPVASWNLKDDNLDHQSDGTKKFLIELLTP